METICQHSQSLDNSIHSTRLKVIISLLLLQGLRQIEICRLDVGGIDLANNRIYIVGKGYIDSEPIYIHPETHKVLSKYLSQPQVKYGALLTHQPTIKRTAVSNEGASDDISELTQRT